MGHAHNATMAYTHTIPNDKGETIMIQSKERKPRATPAEVIASFTREDILACADEVTTLIARKRKLEKRLSRNRTTLETNKAMIDDETIADIMDDIKEDKTTLREVNDKIAYKEGKVRRAALAIFKSTTNLAQFVRDNAHFIPTTNDKTARIGFMNDVTLDEEVLEVI